MSDVTICARVTMTIEFAVTDSWGGDCKLDQVHQQAVESAVGELRRGVAVGRPDGKHVPARLVGEPKVTAVLVERDGSRA